MHVVEILLTNLAVIAGMMVLVWLVSLPIADVSIVDLVWGPGFAVVAWVTFFLTRPHAGLAGLLPSLTTVWAFRLSGYLAWRNLGKPEDKRYRAMREKYGDRFPLLSLGVVFGLQGIVMWIVSLPLQLGQFPSVDPPGAGLFGMGVLFWLCGFVFESVGDYQLAQFQSDPANQGRVLDRGLWRYTRHPNYFGDFLIWWGFFLIAVGQGAPVWTAVGPAVMSFFLLKVSGVTLLESGLKLSKPGYEDYIRRTSAFFPLPPGKPAENTGTSAD